MFDIGFSEMILLAAIALIAIGPKQLPEVARTVGRLINDLKRATGEFTKTVVDARESTNRVINDMTSSFQDTADHINSALIPPTPIQTGVHQEPEPDPHAPILEEPHETAPEEQLSLLDQRPPEEKPEKKDV